MASAKLLVPFSRPTWPVCVVTLATSWSHFLLIGMFSFFIFNKVWDRISVVVTRILHHKHKSLMADFSHHLKLSLQTYTPFFMRLLSSSLSHLIIFIDTYFFLSLSLSADWKTTVGSTVSRVVSSTCGLCQWWLCFSAVITPRKW